MTAFGPHSGVPVKEMTGLRHKLIHDDFEVDLELCDERPQPVSFRRGWL